MPKPYSQLTAMLSITKASFRSILRSPSAVVFSIAFPLIFILVFGFIKVGGTPCPCLPPEPANIPKTIDFILPGQLGFSLLSAGVFGVAFIFFNLRQTLVLKRFFATPINRSYIVLGEGLSRVLFQMLTSIVILTLGHFFFGFTLIHGLETFLELLVLSFIGLMVFMGFGFVVSGLAKTESSIPPLANIVTLPQFLLSGTFFSTDVFPGWLQPICNILPLTQLNNAMRKVAFEGAHLINCGKEIGILIVWALVVYTLAVKFFRWE